MSVEPRSRIPARRVALALVSASVLLFVVGIVDSEPAPYCVQLAGVECPPAELGVAWFGASGACLILAALAAMVGFHATAPAKPAPRPRRPTPSRTSTARPRGDTGRHFHALGLTVFIAVGLVVWT